MKARCPCQHCGSHLEFECDDFQPGMTTECPSCNQETELYISAPPNQPITQSAQIARCHCQHCGDLLEFDAADIGSEAICPSCGMDVPLIQSQSRPKVRSVNRAQAELQAAVRKSKANNDGWFILSFLIPIAGLVIGCWLMTKNQESDGWKCIRLCVLSLIICGIIIAATS